MKMDTVPLATIYQHHHQVSHKNLVFNFALRFNNFSAVPEAIARAVEYLKSLPPYVEPKSQ